jgi:23S rRNA A2030 N6-methylase RlmJ
LVINPPYGFVTAMQDAAGVIAPRLGAAVTTQWIAGSE